MHQITSRAIGKPTKLIWVITDCSSHVTAVVKHGVEIDWVLHRCESSKEPTKIKQCFKCQKCGHPASDCKEELGCLRCTGKHTSCNESKEQAKSTSYGGSHVTVFRSCPSYQKAKPEKKEKQETEYPSAISKKDNQTTQLLTTKKLLSWILKFSIK